MVLIVTGECDREVCKLFSQRGAGCHVRLPAIADTEEVRRFTMRPCTRCGVRPRRVTERWYLAMRCRPTQRTAQRIFRRAR